MKRKQRTVVSMDLSMLTSPEQRAAYRAEMQAILAATKARLDREHNVITSLKELPSGYEITDLVRHKAGVVKYYAQAPWGTNGTQQIIGYAKDSVFAHLQLPP